MGNGITTVSRAIPHTQENGGWLIDEFDKNKSICLTYLI